MKDVCFYTCFDFHFADIGNAMVRSVKRFYPNIDFHIFDVPRIEEKFNLQHFCNVHLEKGLKLLDEYKRIISVDPDHIMCNFSPDLFGDFDLGCVANNIAFGKAYGGIDDKVFINAGLSVCTNKEVWKEWMDEYYKRCAGGWHDWHEQNALNWVFHNTKGKVKLLEFTDRVYGITGQVSYERMYVKNHELYIQHDPILSRQWTTLMKSYPDDFKEEDGLREKKICMFHAAGTQWKNKADGKYDFSGIINSEARELLQTYIS